MTDTRSISSRKVSSADSSSTSSAEGDDEDGAVRASRNGKKEGNKRVLRKLSTHMLDSNGETESDEEISKLQKVIQDQAKELNEEKQATKKLKLMVKLLKRETKQLQKEADKSTKAESSQPVGGTAESDSDSPPWERRKLNTRLAEAESVIREKNTHIEQLLRDCRELEAEKEQCVAQIQLLSCQFDECTKQLQLATNNYSALEETYKDRVTQLESENDRMRIQLDEYQWQKERNEENLDKISDAVDFTVNKCKEIITGKERAIEELQAKLQHYRSTGAANREEEIVRLRAELASATKEMEESAQLLEQFQDLHLGGKGSGTMTDSIKRKLQKLDTLKASRKETERLLAERDEQVAELLRTIKRYESGTYGLSEATKELREARHQLKVRDDHIERLVGQLNALESRIEDLDLENSDLREKFQVDSTSFDPTSKRTLMHQQLTQYKKEIQQLKEENIKLELENRSFKRTTLPSEAKQPSPVKRIAITPPPSGKLLEEYQKAWSEVVVLRKGLVEILQSVREQDATSDVKIESPILERLVAVLDGERLFGQHHGLAKEVESLSEENRGLKETIGELTRQAGSPPLSAGREKESMQQTSSPSQSTKTENETQTERTTEVTRQTSTSFLPPDKMDQGIQVAHTKLTMDSGNDAAPLEPIPETGPSKEQQKFEIEWNQRVQEYQTKLQEVEWELGKVKKELDQLSKKHDAALTEWNNKESDWTDQLDQKEKRIKDLEQEKILLELSRAAPRTAELSLTDDGDGPDEDKIRMEKEIVTLKVRLEHKEQTLKRSHHFLDEVRQEQLKMIEDHSQEVLALQNTILEQQRALHRVEQTQREIAASAASSRAVVRHLESEADNSHQLHAQLSEMAGQLETARKQAAQWKQAAECLSKEKRAFKESLEKDHSLVVEQLKAQWETSQLDVKEWRDKAADLQRQLTEERFDKQRSTLLQVLVAKLKTELDKKEKQMDFLKRLAEELHARIEPAINKSEPLTTSTPIPTTNITSIPPPNETPITTSSSPQEQLSQNLADLELRHTQLEKDFQVQRKQLETIKTREKDLRNQLKEQTAMVERLQTEKGSLTRTMVVLRSRVTKLSGEKVAQQTVPDDVCRLLKRIKELESQLTMFHTAEKPADDSQVVAKSQAMEQWKERKKLQSLVDHLKIKLKELQERIQDDEKQKDALRKTINRLVNEKRVLEDKIKFKANDNERIHRLVEENTQWRIRFETLERQLREMTEEETNTDRHRLQIAVLRDRVKKQEHQIAQLMLVPHGGHNKSANSSSSMIDDSSIRSEFFSQIFIKLKENVQRLINLVQMPTKSNGEKRLTIHEGPPMPDIRRTAQTLHQLIYRLTDAWGVHDS